MRRRRRRNCTLPHNKKKWIDCALTCILGLFVCLLKNTVKKAYIA
jgi:hypothetical protein